MVIIFEDMDRLAEVRNRLGFRGGMGSPKVWKRMGFQLNLVFLFIINHNDCHTQLAP